MGVEKIHIFPSTNGVECEYMNQATSVLTCDTVIGCDRIQVADKQIETIYLTRSKCKLRRLKLLLIIRQFPC